MKKLLVFALLMTLVSTLTMSTVGCGSKKSTTVGSSAPATVPVTAKTEVGKP